MTTVRAISPFAGKPLEPEDSVDIPSLLRAFELDAPDPTYPAQRVNFGTSGHRGSSFDRSLNRHHVLAITQAICRHRQLHQVTGPLFLGFGTHGLSLPAFQTCLEVLVANGVQTMIAKTQELTPTPVISHAILGYNRGRQSGYADGIVMTPSHNPPRDGGMKYNPPHGGPAEKKITDWIQNEANRILDERLDGVQQVPLAKALKSSCTHHHHFLEAYVEDLGNVVNMEVIRESKIAVGVDPLGGADALATTQQKERLKSVKLSELPQKKLADHILNSSEEEVP